MFNLVKIAKVAQAPDPKPYDPPRKCAHLVLEHLLLRMLCLPQLRLLLRLPTFLLLLLRRLP